MTTSIQWAAPAPAPAALNDLCHAVFGSISRSDQRRWADAYVRGLVEVSGRKSVRRISEQVAGPATEQCLQQFVNQSPWNWAPVREMLARAVEPAVRPRAWAVHEVDFPKRGRYSVGVATQYVPGARRTFNCQLGMAVWASGPGGSVPIDWRLMLPPGWDGDPDRRRLARVPDGERHRKPWEYVLCCLDEMIGRWGLVPAPVVADRRHDHRIEELVAGLEERGLQYALRVSERTPVGRPQGRGGVVPVGPLMRSSGHQLVVLPEHRRGPHGTGTGAPAVTYTAVPSIGAPRMRPGLGPVRPRRVVARWQRGRTQPPEIWVTNLGVSPLPELLDLFDVPDRITARSHQLRSECGLDHFEGRSYRGWHHHVTLASVAFAHRELAGADEMGLALPC